MSDDSHPDNATDPSDSAGPTSASAPASLSGAAGPKRGTLRQIILFCLLGVMLVALAYDYRIARPNVEKAFDQIVHLNDQMNLSAKPTPTLNSDIRKEIGRDPARVYSEGPYRIEVFSWTSGLPFRTHDLFAVYVPNGNDLVFMRHYKFALPDNELDSPKPQPAEGEVTAMPAPPVGMTMDDDGAGGRGGPGGEGGGRGGPGGGGGGRPQRPSGEDQDENPGAAEGSPVTPDAEGAAPSENPTPSDATSDTPEASAPEGTAPAEGAPAEGAPEGSTPAGSATPAEQPAAANPPVEADTAPAAGAAKEGA